MIMKKLLLSLIILTTISLNAKAQWQRTSGPFGSTICSLAISGTNLFAGTLGGGVFLSTNNGVSWNAVNNGLPPYVFNCVLSLAVSGANIFIGTDNGGVFLSTNNGASWAAVNSGLINTYIY